MPNKNYIRLTIIYNKRIFEQNLYTKLKVSKIQFNSKKNLFLSYSNYSSQRFKFRVELNFTSQIIRTTNWCTYSFDPCQL